MSPSPGNQNQWVGWRYIIQRDGTSMACTRTIYKSPFVKDKA